MLSYYLELAIRSLRRNVIVTVLIVAAVGVGIGASMTVLTTFVAMSRDPIPAKSAQLFVPQIDIFGPDSRGGRGDPVWLPPLFTYRDAMALMHARAAVHQAAMYRVALNVNPPAGNPFEASVRATYADFFTMFDVPFRSGGPWGQHEDEGRQNVVVLTSKIAERVFPHSDPVGRTITLGARDYRIVGVIEPWTPSPRFYDLFSDFWRAYGESEDVFIPFSVAIELQVRDQGGIDCDSPLPSGWSARLNSNCGWLQFWVQLPSASQVHKYKDFLTGYAAEQQRLGRFHWPPLVQLFDVNGWLDHQHVLPEGVRVNTLIAAGFLIVCLVNALGLMLAKFSARTKELALQRALGASKIDIFMQCVAETLIIGLLGGILGLVLTAAGLWSLRALNGGVSTSSATGHLYSLDTTMVLITLGVAVAATVCSGLYPALQASRVQPAWQLKAQ